MIGLILGGCHLLRSENIESGNASECPPCHQQCPMKMQKRNIWNCDDISSTNSHKSDLELRQMEKLDDSSDNNAVFTSHVDNSFGLTDIKEQKLIKDWLQRMDSTADHTPCDEFTDSLLKTPAGFYDRSFTPFGLSIPPLFDYSADPSVNFCRNNSATDSSEMTTLCSIVEEERQSEVSEVLSQDFDGSTTSQYETADERITPLPSPDEESDLSDHEDCVVFSVLHNVLSDDIAKINVYDITKTEPSSKPVTPETLPTKPSTTECSSQPVLCNKDDSKLNPFARPFMNTSRVPSCPVPVVFTPTMPTVVYPVKFTYTKLLPASVTKDSSPPTTCLSNTKKGFGGTPLIAPLSNTGNTHTMCQPQIPVASQYYYGYPANQSCMYYYSMWQPAYYVGQPCTRVVPATTVLPAWKRNSPPRLVKQRTAQVNAESCLLGVKLT